MSDTAITRSRTLDQREEHARIPGPVPGLELFARYLPAHKPHAGACPVLYVHGGTFPSALSIAHRFDGRSWRDELADAGFDTRVESLLSSRAQRSDPG